MVYVIGPKCIDTMDRSCVEECPVDCIYEGERKLYINPDECIDCGACEPACPELAITHHQHAGEGWTQDAQNLFSPEFLREHGLQLSGGATATGPLGVDTPRVQGWPGI